MANESSIKNILGPFSTSSRTVIPDAPDLHSEKGSGRRVSISTLGQKLNECKYNRISENTWNYKAIC